MRTPGIAVSAIINGQIIDVQSGFANLDTKTELTTNSRFKLACMQKMLVAMVLARLANDDRIKLTAPLSQYLPELQGGSHEKIIVRHLLSHTSGYQGENIVDPDVMSEYSWNDFVASWTNRTQLFEPGTVFDYSHSAFVLAAKIAERVTGKSIWQLIQEFYLEPLGIQTLQPDSEPLDELVVDHVYDPQRQTLVPSLPVEWSDFWRPSFVAPRLTLREFLLVVQSGISSTTTIRDENKSLLLTPIINLATQFGSQAEDLPVDFGLGCARFTNGLYGLSASAIGQCTAVRFDATGQFVVVVGMSATKPFLRDWLVNTLAKGLLQVTPIRPAAITHSPQPDFDLHELCGVYEGARQSSFEATLDQDRLVLRRGHNPSISYNSHHRTFVIERNRTGKLVLTNNTPDTSIGFFRDPITSVPCLAFGMKSYRRAN